MRSIFGCFQSFCVSRLHLKKKDQEIGGEIISDNYGNDDT